MLMLISNRARRFIHTRNECQHGPRRKRSELDHYLIYLILSQLLKKKWPRFIWFMNFVKLF